MAISVSNICEGLSAVIKKVDLEYAIRGKLAAAGIVVNLPLTVLERKKRNYVIVSVGGGKLALDGFIADRIIVEPR